LGLEKISRVTAVELEASPQRFGRKVVPGKSAAIGFYCSQGALMRKFANESSASSARLKKCFSRLRDFRRLLPQCADEGYVFLKPVSAPCADAILAIGVPDIELSPGSHARRLWRRIAF
jgi:hypothetical protein